MKALFSLVAIIYLAMFCYGFSQAPAKPTCSHDTTTIEYWMNTRVILAKIDMLDSDSITARASDKMEDRIFTFHTNDLTLYTKTTGRNLQVGKTTTLVDRKYFEKDRNKKYLIRYCAQCYLVYQIQDFTE